MSEKTFSHFHFDSDLIICVLSFLCSCLFVLLFTTGINAASKHCLEQKYRNAREAERTYYDCIISHRTGGSVEEGSIRVDKKHFYWLEEGTINSCRK